MKTLIIALSYIDLDGETSPKIGIIHKPIIDEPTPDHLEKLCLDAIGDHLIETEDVNIYSKKYKRVYGSEQWEEAHDDQSYNESGILIWLQNPDNDGFHPTEEWYYQYTYRIIE